jgi:PIN domain nuclease of toxin-antitoxin system
MKLLLETHSFLWWDNEPNKLSTAALAAIVDPANSVYLSVVSVWEIVIKSSIGKLTLTSPLADRIARQEANGVQILPANLSHVLAVGALPMIHKDPFDRLLVAQTNVEGFDLVSDDQLLDGYAIRRLW